MVELKIPLPDGFLDEEERCGHLISHEMKMAWAVMLDLLMEFDRVCKKNGIKYFASGGTMLGAVRHKGFIPWDDDIDVMMFREDYDKLLEVGPKEFHHPYFFQNKLTDPCCIDLISKLRNSETTALMDYEIGTKYNYNRGIFIDIFPLDFIPEDHESFVKLVEHVENHKQKLYKKGKQLGIFTPTQSFIQQMIKNTLYSLLSKKRRKEIDAYKQLFLDLETVCRTYKGQNRGKVAALAFSLDRCDIKSYDDNKDVTPMDFEFIKIPVGTGHDHALKVKYGDYMTFKREGAYHSSIIFNTDKSYREYSK